MRKRKRAGEPCSPDRLPGESAVEQAPWTTRQKSEAAVQKIRMKSNMPGIFRLSKIRILPWNKMIALYGKPELVQRVSSQRVSSLLSK